MMRKEQHKELQEKMKSQAVDKLKDDHMNVLAASMEKAIGRGELTMKGKVKEEEIDGSSYNIPYPDEPPLMYLPQPLESLHEAVPPPFLTKTYDLVDDPSTDHVISWTRGNNSFVVWDPQKFSFNLLPIYFKHTNFSSFVRQLNTWFSRQMRICKELFLRGQRQLLKSTRRRKTSFNPQTSQSTEACVEVGRFGLDVEIDRLRCDKQVLMCELVKLRLQQQNTKSYLQTIEQKLRGTEQRQKQMMSFLAKAIQNPEFLHNLVQKNGEREEIGEEIARKGRRPIDHQDHSNLGIEYIQSEADHFGAISGFEIPSEMEGKVLAEGFGEGFLAEKAELDDLHLCLSNFTSLTTLVYYIFSLIVNQ